MKRKLFVPVLLLCLVVSLVFSAQAADLPRFVDGAGLLSQSQADELNAKLDQMSERLNFDFVIATTQTTNGMGAEEASCQIYDYYHYGYGPNHDGVILFINMGERDWFITSTGSGEDYINRAARDYIADEIVPLLSSGNYNGAFRTFADLACEMVESGMNGRTYRDPFPLLRNLLIGLGVSMLIALIVVSKYKSDLKTVKAQYSAASYETPGSLNITRARDQFLYHQITRTPRPKPQNNSSRGGGGISHSSSGGKF